MSIATAVMAAGSAVEGISKSIGYAYQGEVARNNAKTAQQNEAYAASAGAANTEREGLKAAQQLSGTRAALAAQNVDVNRGSAADVQVGQRQIGALDQATVASNAALEAYGYRTKWASFQNQAHLDDAAAIMAPIQAAFNVGGDIASGKPETSGGGIGSVISASGAPSDPSASGAPSAQGIDTSVDPSVLSGPDELPEDFGWMGG